MEIIFDFDGTVADSLGSLIKILGDLAPEFGFKPITQYEIDIYREEGAREALKKLKVSLFKLPKIIQRCQEEQTKKIADIKIIDGLVDVLHTLKAQGFVLGILTSNSKENVEKFLVKNEIDIFSYIYSEKNLFGKEKIIKHLLKERGLKVGDVIYVGDEVRDIEACKKAGVKIVAVSWGFNSKNILEKYEPDWLIDEPEGLLDII
ncbi:MAG: HAD-IA family hydrolase [Candidatus Shapirobacteria bacterium]|nr:HAD-IA family hydrolase [Candidatus Shapirobacteria bacterium]